MGKRDGGKFEKIPRDYYPTIDPSAIPPLLPFIMNKTYIEPCHGQGHLVGLINTAATCVGGYDITDGYDASEMVYGDADLFITNPPFTWKVLSPIIDNLMKQKPTFMLLPADIMHNIRMSGYMKKCATIISIGRLYWQDNKIKGVDNYVWYLFDANHSGPTEFIGR